MRGRRAGPVVDGRTLAPADTNPRGHKHRRGHPSPVRPPARGGQAVRGVLARTRLVVRRPHPSCGSPQLRGASWEQTFSATGSTLVGRRPCEARAAAQAKAKREPLGPWRPGPCHTPGGRQSSAAVGGPLRGAPTHCHLPLPAACARLEDGRFTQAQPGGDSSRSSCAGGGFAA